MHLLWDSNRFSYNTEALVFQYFTQFGRPHKSSQNHFRNTYDLAFQSTFFSRRRKRRLHPNNSNNSSFIGLPPATTELNFHSNRTSLEMGNPFSIDRLIAK